MACFSPDGQEIATASADQTARIWSAVTGDPLAAPLKHSDDVYAVAFSPDGRAVATASHDRTARIWDASSGQAISAPLRHLGSVVQVCFSPNGQHLLTASLDRTARVWDVRTGQPVTPPLTHAGWVEACGFSPDGTKVVTGSFDGTARIWDAATGEPLSMPFHHRQRVADTSFSPDGRVVATASYDGRAQLWEVPSLDWPVGEITSLAQLYASEKLGPSGDIQPLSPNEIGVLEDQVSRRLHRSILATTNELSRWHRRQLASCETEMNWSAAKFHARRLVDLEPNDAKVREDLTRVEQHLPPPREPGTPPELIDLSDFYNASLMVRWHPGGEGNDLSELPQGVQSFAGTRFDVRGLVQVFGSPGVGGYNYPRDVGGIPIHRKLERLQFLQSMEGHHLVAEGTRVGYYVIHFANGRTERLDVIYGRDGRDWHEWPDSPVGASEAVIAWKGRNRAMAEVGTLSIRLFKRTWVNQTPEVEVTTVDLVADHPTANPFLVALTAE